MSIGVPARNEVEVIEQCLDSLDRLRRDARVLSVHVTILANNCSDATPLRARAFTPTGGMDVAVVETHLPPEMAHAGWARRMALDAAAACLEDPSDVLLSTDADTVVGKEWLLRTLDYLDEGYDAVAGLARLNPRELRSMDRSKRERLTSIRRYMDATEYLRGRTAVDEPWPRHYYEGGASIALTLAAFRRVGGAPTPPVGEDKALFARLRECGCRIRHPRDVKVLTSCRLEGRAKGGAADTLAQWGSQGASERLHDVSSLHSALSPEASFEDGLTFERLPDETERARRLVRALRNAARGGDETNRSGLQAAPAMAGS